MAGEHENVVPHFATTSWTEIRAAGGPDPDARCQALQKLLPRYESPIKAYLTSKYHFTADQADDIFQEFIKEKVLKQNLMELAEHRRGRFRTFLLKALDNFVKNEVRKSKAQKRSPEGGLLSLDEIPADAQPFCDEASVLAFEEQWMRTVFVEAVDRMRRECMGQGREQLWHVFESCVLRQLVDGGEPAGYEELVRKCRFGSPAQVYNAKAAAKALFVRKVREVIAECVECETEVDDVLDDWKRLFVANLLVPTRPGIG